MQKLFYIPAFLSIFFLLLTEFAKAVEPETLFKNKNNVIQDEEETANQLYRAIELGELEDVKRFQIELDINYQDRNGITPLYLSVFHNRTALVSYYLKNNADINISDNDGLAPLHVAGLENLPEMIGLLLNNGQN